MWTPRILRKRVKTDSKTAQYHQGDIFTGGAESAVYEPAYPVLPAILPPVNLLGAAILAGAAPNPLQGPQVYANQAAFVTGVGGVMAGQFVFQPLNVSDPGNGGQ